MIFYETPPPHSHLVDQMCRCFDRFLCSTGAQSKGCEAIGSSDSCQWRLLVSRRIIGALETIVPDTVYWQLLMLLRPSSHTQHSGNHWCSSKPSSHTQCIDCYYCISASSNHCPTKCEAISSYRVAKIHKIPYL